MRLPCWTDLSPFYFLPFGCTILSKGARHCYRALFVYHPARGVLVRPRAQYLTKGLLMETPVIWKRPDLQFPTPFDTIFFDVDGVLIKTIASFHATDIATAEYVAGGIHSLDWGQREGKHLLTHDDVI